MEWTGGPGNFIPQRGPDNLVSKANPEERDFAHQGATQIEGCLSLQRVTRPRRQNHWKFSSVKSLNGRQVIGRDTHNSSPGTSLPQPGKDVETEAVEMVDKADQFPDLSSFTNQPPTRPGNHAGGSQCVNMEA